MRPVAQRIAIAVAGITHQDYISRLALLHGLRTAYAEKKLDAVAMGFEKEHEIPPKMEQVASLMSQVNEKLGAAGYKKAMNDMLRMSGATVPVLRSSMIDAVANTVLIKACEKENFPHLELEAPELAAAIDRESVGKYEQRELESITVKYEERRIAAMVQNIEKLARMVPRGQNVFMTLLVGAVHVPTLTVACRDHFEGRARIFPTMLLSEQATEEMGCDSYEEGRGFMRRSLEETLIRSLMLKNFAGLSPEEIQERNQKSQGAMMVLSEMVEMKAEEHGKTAAFSGLMFRRMIEDASAFLRAPAASPAAAEADRLAKEKSKEKE